MKFCPVVPEICRGQVHGARKERRIRIRIRIIIIIRRNGAKTISLQTLFGRLNKKKRSKNNKSPKLCLGDLKRVIFGMRNKNLFKYHLNHIFLSLICNIKNITVITYSIL
jgi:hypothetical protein